MRTRRPWRPKELNRCRPPVRVGSMSKTPDRELILRAMTAKWADCKLFLRREDCLRICLERSVPACSICCIAAWAPTVVCSIRSVFLRGTNGLWVDFSCGQSPGASPGAGSHRGRRATTSGCDRNVPSAGHGQRGSLNGISSQAGGSCADHAVANGAQLRHCKIWFVAGK